MLFVKISYSDKVWVRYLVRLYQWSFHVTYSEYNFKVLFLIIAETVNAITDFELTWQPLITENGEISFLTRIPIVGKNIDL